jgi:hypothetical protein
LEQAWPLVELVTEAPEPSQTDTKAFNRNPSFSGSKRPDGNEVQVHTVKDNFKIVLCTFVSMVFAASLKMNRVNHESETENPERYYIYR